jgi:adenylate cyclase
MKLLIKYLLLVILVSASVIGINYQYPDHFKGINSKVMDLLFQSREIPQQSKNVTIIDIDDYSISEIGQWPWSRNTIAKLIQNLSENGPSTIGLNIVFSEEDRSSPSNFSSASDAENYDEILALTVENSDIPIILGYTLYPSCN